MPLPDVIPVHAACTNCLKHTGDEPTLKLLRCGKCRDVTYCSKECQRGHWQRHKKWCTPADGSGIRSIAQKFVTSRVGHICIQICFILHYDLFRNTELGIDKPFVAMLDFGIEPVEMEDFLSILLGKPTPDKIKGLLQVNGFQALTPEEAEDSFTPATLGVWRHARQQLNKKGFSDRPVGLVQIANGVGTQMMTLPVAIDDMAIELVRESLHSAGPSTQPADLG
ncbi:hypothetical protein C8R43DRAFT_943325 [Mycena crocata]|nr:hypothetical protein C8R43DRAFT_943325 [Mycena crocata]